MLESYKSCMLQTQGCKFCFCNSVNWGWDLEERRQMPFYYDSCWFWQTGPSLVRFEELGWGNQNPCPVTRFVGMKDGCGHGQSISFLTCGMSPWTDLEIYSWVAALWLVFLQSCQCLHKPPIANIKLSAGITLSSFCFLHLTLMYSNEISPKGRLLFINSFVCLFSQ